jgi:hypothetical protein
LFQFRDQFETNERCIYFTAIIERSVMSRESTEELRQRLLKDERVRDLISRRAYEIYLMRGGRPGGEAHDWFQAESEIISILIEEESLGSVEYTRNDSSAASQADDEVMSASPVAEAIGVPETSERAGQPQGLTAEERAESQSQIGAWSPAEPSSTERAPAIGDAGDFQTGAAPLKKAGTRAAKKAAAPREGKASTEKSAASKSPAPKRTTGKRAATNKPVDAPAKAKKSGRKSSEGKSSE